jgi:endosialidase-like protein
MGENRGVRRALEFLDGGHENTAVGWGAGSNYTGVETNNICIGDQTLGVAGESDAIRIGDNSTSLGIDVLNNGAALNLISIGPGLSSGGINILVTGLGSTVQIGALLPTVAGAANCFIGGIASTAAIGGEDFVMVDLATNQLRHQPSSRRYKEDIKPMGKASEALYWLKPVKFRYKESHNLDYGLIAEDVAEVDPNLANRNGEGQIESVRYFAIYNMMLNEFLKEHKKVEEQQASIAELRSTVGVLTAQLKEQAAQIQKVSAQIEVNKPAPQVVVNKP